MSINSDNILKLLKKDKATQHVLKELSSKKPANYADLVGKISQEFDNLALPFMIRDSLDALLKLNAIEQRYGGKKGVSYIILKYGIDAYQQFSKNH